MVRRSTPPEPQCAILTVDQMKRGIIRLQKRIDDLEAFNPNSVQERGAPEVKALQTAIDETLTAVFGHKTVEYNRYQRAAVLDHGPHRINHKASPSEAQQYVAEGKRGAIVALQQAIRGLEEEIGEQDHIAQLINLPIAVPALTRKVFIVHGHDEAAKESVARFLEKIGFEAVILHERPNKGRTIITKFREEAADIGFAVVLMTPDDHGAKSGADTSPRARQNVVFELGFFIGVLGQERVAALVKGDIEPPSDFDGVAYISLDNGTWKMELSKELAAAGYKIDWNDVMHS